MYSFRKLKSFLFIICAGFCVLAARPAPDANPKADQIENSLRGKLLVASPQLAGSIFSRSVILMVEHDANGAFGLILNKPVSTIPKSDVFDKLNLKHQATAASFTIFSGGPVEPRTILVVHDGTFEGPVIRDVATGVAVSAERPVIEALARGEGPSRYVIVAGYSGWAPGQLESELQRQDWETAPLDREVIFDDNYDTKWKRAMENRFRTL